MTPRQPYTGERREYLRTYNRERYGRIRAAWLAEHGPCAKCGSSLDLEVDHIDPSIKSTHRVWSWSADRRAVELAKCQVLCGACHLEKTRSQFKKPIPHGTHSGYAYHKCRCADCTEAQRQYCGARQRGAA